MVTVTDIYTDTTATVAPWEFAATVTPWFPGAPADVLDTIAQVQTRLEHHEFIAGSAISSLGLIIAEEGK